MTIGLGLAMLLPMLADIMVGSTQWRIFGFSATVTLTLGGTLAILGFAERAQTAGKREASLLTVLSWLVLVILGMIPFLMFGLSPTDAFFEAMSGLTTTGATVMTGLDELGNGILLWRAILQWIGGIGIIVTAIAIFPNLRMGGMQLFALESSDNSQMVMPRVRELAILIGLTYLGMSAACAIAYGFTGMSAFDAIAHAMTTMSAGGFSTKDASMAAFMAGGSDLVAIVFMLLAGLPFVLYIQFVRGKITSYNDPQVKLYFQIVILAILLLTALQLVSGQSREFSFEFLRLAAFNTISILTGTGYATADFTKWGDASQSVFLWLALIGGCAGSAACGLKIFRLHVGWLALTTYIRKLLYPSRVLPVKFKGKKLSDSDLQSVLVFIFVFFTSFVGIAALLSLMGLDFITAMSAAASSLANVGPGLGDIIGPVGTYQSLPDAAKWLCAFAMLLGRLELMVVLTLFTRSFWRS